MTPATLGQAVTIRLPENTVLGVGEGFTPDGANTYTRANTASNLVTTDTAVPDDGLQTLIEPLTARFEAKPASHDGETPFSLRLAFSEAVTATATELRDQVVQVTGGTATAVAPVDGSRDLWELTIEPESGADVTVRVPPGGTCGETGTVCTEDGRALANGLLALVAGPGSADTRSAPLTARFEEVPEEHDAVSAFTFRLAFSAALKVSFRTLRDQALSASGGTVTKAKRVDGRSDLWAITVEPSGNGAVTVTLPASVPCGEAHAICTEDGRALSGSISTTIQGPPGLSVADAEVQEAANAVLAFAVTLDRAGSSTVTVDYATADGTATAGSDYTATSGTLNFAAGETAKTVTVPVQDDSHDEGSETLTLTLSNASGAYLADGTATGTITNNDPIPKAWIARFGRTVADHVLDAVDERLRGSAIGRGVGQPGRPEDRVRSGRAAPAPDAKVGKSRGWSRTMTGRQVLMGSSFSLAAETGSGGSAALWGRMAQSRFAGREDALSLDGDVITGLVGADYAWDRWTTAW